MRTKDAKLDGKTFHGIDIQWFKIHKNPSSEEDGLKFLIYIPMLYRKSH